MYEKKRRAGREGGRGEGGRQRVIRREVWREVGREGCGMKYYTLLLILSLLSAFHAGK